MKTLHLPLTALLAIAALAPAPMARADAIQQQAFGVWKSEDACARDAFKKFPDYTAESNRARDLFEKKCLDNRHLPPRSSEPYRPAPETPTKSNGR